MAFVNSIPDKLLHAIFRSGETQLGELSVNRPFLFTVSQVNSQWRKVALSSPDAWSIISISSSWSTAIAALYIERSNPLPLDLSLDLASPNVTKIWQQLGTSSLERCRKLSIRSKDYSSLEAVAKSLQDGHASLLEEIEFALLRPTQEDKPTIHILTKGAPSLRSVKIHNIRCQILPPLTGLTSLALNEFHSTYDELRDMLAASPALVELALSKFKTMTKNNHQGNPPPTIEIPSLRSFAISFHPGHLDYPCNCLLPTLSMPNLRYLELSGRRIPILLDHFQSNTNVPKFEHLKTLRLHDLIISETNLTPFQAIPTVQNLELLDVLFLSVPSDGGESARDEEVPLRLWPHVRSIAFYTRDITEMKWLRDTLRARAKLGVQIPDLRVSESMWSAFGARGGLNFKWSDFDGCAKLIVSDFCSDKEDLIAESLLEGSNV